MANIDMTFGIKISDNDVTFGIGIAGVKNMISIVKQLQSWDVEMFKYLIKDIYTGKFY